MVFLDLSHEKCIIIYTKSYVMSIVYGGVTMNALDIARYIIQKNATIDAPISNLRLQKILYYVQGYAYKQLNRPAFADAIYRWPYGPVVPTVYFAYNSNRANNIYELDDVDAEPIRILRANDGIKAIADRVDAACKKRTTTELVSMTHLESPWLDTVASQEIGGNIIQSFFENSDPLDIVDLDS